MGLSVKEIENLLFNYQDDWYSEGWSYWDNENYGTVTLSIGLDADLVAKGGPTGLDYEKWLVVRVTDMDGTERFFKKIGYYSSYEGTSWDGSFHEVFPQQKTVTVYEKE
jgi:hypothetical protein